MENCNTTTPVATLDSNTVSIDVDPEATPIETVSTDVVTDVVTNVASSVEPSVAPSVATSVEPSVATIATSTNPETIIKATNKDLDIVNVEQKSDEWLQLRQKYISASSVATALGFNGESSYTRYIEEKTTGISSFKGNTCTHFGELFEDTARSVFEHYKHCKVYEVGFMVNKKYPCLGISPDGVVDYTTDTPLELLEIKCPYSRIADGKVKNDYYHQIQMQLAVTELDTCNFLECNFDLECYKDSEILLELSSNKVMGIVEIGGNFRLHGYEPWDHEHNKIPIVYYPRVLKTVQTDLYTSEPCPSYNEFVSQVETLAKTHKRIWLFKLTQCSLQRITRDPNWITKYYKNLEHVHTTFTEGQNKRLQPCSLFRRTQRKRSHSGNSV